MLIHLNYPPESLPLLIAVHSNLGDRNYDKPWRTSSKVAKSGKTSVLSAVSLCLMNLNTVELENALFFKCFVDVFFCKFSGQSGNKVDWDKTVKLTSKSFDELTLRKTLSKDPSAVQVSTDLNFKKKGLKTVLWFWLVKWC